jgi:Lactoylglutathione lyase and related lyases
MKFNKLIPELTVKNIEKTKKFYLDILGFKMEYGREENKFVFLSFEGAQFMFEEIHEDGWNVGEMAYPLGQGVNFSIEVGDIDKMYQKIISNKYPLYRTMAVNEYRSNDSYHKQKEFLVQDPDGYLLRFTEEQ